VPHLNSGYFWVPHLILKINTSRSNKLLVLW